MSTTIRSFFDRQKLDLSDKSNEDDERKKEREQLKCITLNVSLNKYDTGILYFCYYFLYIL